MAAEYTKLLNEIDDHGWAGTDYNVNIPGHPETRFSSPSGKYEVEIRPKNGYDDGNLHESQLHFVVRVYKYQVGDNGDRHGEDMVFGRRKDTADEAINLAQAKIDEYAQKSDA